MVKNLETIKRDLNLSPMYNLSLSDKELFHSNFLAWLGNNDDTKPFFKKVIKKLSSIDLNQYNNWIVLREDKNFDIGIIEEKTNEKGKKYNDYILVVENKVKSIPRKDQLDEYKSKIEEYYKSNNYPTHFLLLTLASKFPDKNSISKENIWEIKTYKDLAAEMEQQNDSLQDQYHKSLIEDYIGFIENLNELQELMINDFNNQQYYYEDELTKYKEIRIHDLYIKLRASLFVSELEPRENIHIMPFPYLDKNNKTRNFKHSDIRHYCKTKKGVHIFLDYGIQQGNGMVAAYIYKHNYDNDYIYEIAIQGNQYRHGINSHKEGKKDKTKKLDKLWETVYNHDKNWFDCILKQKTLPTNGHNKYTPDYVYKYVKIDKEKVEELLTAMKEDINNVIGKFEKNSKTVLLF